MFTANHNSGNSKTSEIEQITAKLTAEQVDEAQKLAEEYIEKYGEA